MKGAQLLASLVALVIWYYILYSILIFVHPDRLIWFLFWTHVPLGLFVRVLGDLIEKEQK